MEDKPLNAQARQVWEQRNGQRITIDQIDLENGAFPIRVGQYQSWMATGRYWAEGYNHSKDLIKQVLD